MPQKAYNEVEKEAFLETGSFIYSNPFTRWITNEGHKACARLRRFDLSGGIVIDLGCGEGDHFPYITYANVIGIDILPEMLARARRKFPDRAQLVQGDIFKLPFKDNSIRSITSFGNLEHLTQLSYSLEEIHRILAYDGEFVFGIPTEGIIYRLGRELTTKRHVEKVTGVDYGRLVDKEHINKCNYIIKTLKMFFKIDKLRGVPLYSPNITLNFVIVGRCVKK